MTDGVVILPHRMTQAWVRMTGRATRGGRSEQRTIYCTDDPRDDPAMLGSLQASIRRYVGDHLGVPADERGPDFEAGFRWTFGVHESGVPPFGTIWDAE